MRNGSWARRIVRRALLVVLLISLVGILPADGYTGAARADFTIRRAVEGEGFNFVAWEAQAITQKLRDALTRPGEDLTPEAQAALVTGYFDRVRKIDALNIEIERLYAEQGATAVILAAPLETELVQLRAARGAERAAVEWIIEQQVAAVLTSEGLDTAGHIFPPVRFQFTESPNLLILSPRDRISYDRAVHLNPALSVAQMERIEEQVQTALDNTSALVEGTGGFSSYPTMVLEYGVLEWVIDTVAHEWVHTYLMVRPLGWNYAASGGMRTINETVASIVGEEISRRVIERFYPERLNAAPWPRPLSMRGNWLSPAPDDSHFDYGAFMRKTRLETDRLLTAGQVTEAEHYMEARRQELLAQGYIIRKLNQAFFAFHGSYAVGAFATDPIGAKLRALRARVADLHDFIQVVARFDDPADLDAALSTALMGGAPSQ